MFRFGCLCVKCEKQWVESFDHETYNNLNHNFKLICPKCGAEKRVTARDFTVEELSETRKKEFKDFFKGNRY